jgi:hypothetical protein
MILHCKATERFTGKVVSEFWWSRERGVTASHPEVLHRLAATGIAAPPDGEVLYPDAGEAFIRALVPHYDNCTYRACTEVEVVQQQGGDPITGPVTRKSMWE